MDSGVFITFEGGEGTGKSTHCKRLVEYLCDKGHEVIFLREPGSTSIGEKIRSILLDINNTEMNPVSELLLYEAARAQMVDEIIKPALERNCVVICDRFSDSTIAYQGYGRGIDIELVNRLNEIVCSGIKVDRTILMERNAQEGLNEAKTKGIDRIEAEAIEFHEAVKSAFDRIAEEDPKRVRRVYIANDPDETFALILKEIEDLF